MIVTSENLSQVLQQLSHLGKPTLGIYGIGAGAKGWHAGLDLPAPAGCQAKVASTFDHPTPESALQQVVERLEALRGASVAEQAGNSRLKLVQKSA